MEKFEQIEIFGKRALYANERILQKDVPKGLYVYHIRGNDDTTGGFCSIEPYVLVNNYGSVIMKEPLDFGKDGYILFNEETEPNFLNEPAITIEEFAKITYIVLCDWAFKDMCGWGNVIFVTKNKEKAMEIMEEEIQVEKKESWISEVDPKEISSDCALAEENGCLYVEEVSPDSWSFFANGRYDEQHTTFRIETCQEE